MKYMNICITFTTYAFFLHVFESMTISIMGMPYPCMYPSHMDVCMLDLILLF